MSSTLLLNAMLLIPFQAEGAAPAAEQAQPERFRVVRVVPANAYVGVKPAPRWAAYPHLPTPPMSRTVLSLGDPAAHRATQMLREAMRLAEKRAAESRTESQSDSVSALDDGELLGQ